MRLTFFLNITRPARCKLEACYRVRVRVPRYGNYGHRRAPVEHGANMRAQTLASASLMVDHDAVALSEAQGLVILAELLDGNLVPVEAARAVARRLDLLGWLAVATI